MTKSIKLLSQGILIFIGIGISLSVVNAVVFSPQTLLAQDNWLLLEQRRLKGTKQESLNQFSAKIVALAVSRNGQILLVGTEDNKITAINLQTQKIIYTLPHSINNFASIAVSQDNKIFAIASQENVIISRLSDGKNLHTLKGHTSEVNDVALSPDDNFVVSVSGGDRSIRVWDLLQSGELLKTLTNEVGIPTTVDFTPDGTMFITGGIQQDRTFKFWESTNFKLLKTSPQQPGFINSITITDNGSYLVAAIRNLVRSWDLKTGKQLMSVKGPSLEINAIAVSPDNRTVATANKEGTIMLFDLVTRRQIKTLSGHKGWVLSLAFSHDGKYLYSGAEDKTVKVWQIKP